MTQPTQPAAVNVTQPVALTATSKIEEILATNKSLGGIADQLRRLAAVIDTYINGEITSTDARDLIGTDQLGGFKADLSDVRAYGVDFLTQIADLVQKATGTKTTDLTARLAQELAEHAELTHLAEDGAALASFVALHLKLQLKLDEEPTKPAATPAPSLFAKFTAGLYNQPAEPEKDEQPKRPSGNWLTPPIYTKGKAYAELARAQKAIKTFKSEAALATGLKTMGLNLEDITSYAEEVMRMARDQQAVSNEAVAKAQADTAAIAAQMKAWAVAADYADQVEKYLGLESTPTPKKK